MSDTLFGAAHRIAGLSGVALIAAAAIALTAFAGKDDRLQALEAGYQKHVPKPVEPTDLVAAVASLAESSKKARG